MTRKDFFTQVGVGVGVLVLAQCGISCQKSATTTTNTTSTVDFTVDVSTGNLASNGGSLIKNGIIIARTKTGSYIAVSASCPHAGTNVGYNSSAASFVCPNHGATFTETGKVTQGPASSNLTQYNTTLTGTSLRVYS